VYVAIVVPEELKTVRLLVVVPVAVAQTFPEGSIANPNGLTPALKVPWMTPEELKSDTVFPVLFATQTFPEASITRPMGVAPVEDVAKIEPEGLNSYR